jgi:TfoX/Sxy family transcriptional regulator of competence genes
VFLKTDPLSQPGFSAAGTSPFIHVAKGKPMATSFWRLPAAAHDEADELVRWASLGARGGEACGRSQGEKTKPARRKG